LRIQDRYAGTPYYEALATSEQQTQVLREFFDENYPGVRYRSIMANTPEELAKILQEK